MKLNRSGLKEWDRTYSQNVGSLDVSNAIDGGYIMIGQAGMIKIDGVGNIEWTSPEVGTDIIQASDGSYISLNNSVVKKLSENGTTIWSNQIDEFNGNTIAEDLINEGGYIIGGVSSGPSSTVMKLENDGQVKWINNYGWDKYGLEPPGSILYSIMQSVNGDYISSGEWTEISSTNNDGQLLWSNTSYCAACDIYSTGVAISGFSNYYIFTNVYDAHESEYQNSFETGVWIYIYDDQGNYYERIQVEGYYFWGGGPRVLDGIQIDSNYAVLCGNKLNPENYNSSDYWIRKMKID